MCVYVLSYCSAVLDRSVWSMSFLYLILILLVITIHLNFVTSLIFQIVFNISLQVIFDPYRTGFEDSKTFAPPKGTIIAGRYEVTDVLGQVRRLGLSIHSVYCTVESPST